MSVATMSDLGRRRYPGGLALLSATAVLAFSTVGCAGEDASGQAIRPEASDLRFVRTYEVGKTPVVFIHGLLGNPANFSAMIDSLADEPAVRARFQVLTFRYNSLQSIPESGLRLAKALDDARRRFDPEGREASFERVVLVGHSMGGLVAKAASHAVDRQGLELVQARSEVEELRRASRVARYIFIATPHRGAPIDRGAIRSVGSWLARSVSPPPSARGSQSSSVDQLVWEHPLLAELERARVKRGAPFHSIIAALGDPAAEVPTDGLVPVASARLVGAQSEVVVRTHHFCLDQPEVIGEVRRILIDDAVTPGGRAPNAAGLAASISE
jgi:pimeloyl-ACP methyl ester carboxylesterase